MKFSATNKVNGTSLQGYVPSTYKRLVEVFGHPHTFGGDKTTVEWGFRFADGTVATIYDWKMDRTPQGLYDWHIGGNSKKAVDRVLEAFQNHKATSDYMPSFEIRQFEKLLRKANMSAVDITYLQNVLKELQDQKNTNVYESSY